MSFKICIVLAAFVAVSQAVVSGDYHSIGVQNEQTVRGALNTLSSYSKAINTDHSQSFVSRTDYTNNPGLIAHAPIIAAAPAYHAPIAAYHAAPVAAYHAPVAAYHGAAYAAPVAAYHGAAYPAPVAAYHGAAPYPYAAYGAAYKAPYAGAIYH